jgi:superoxide dismutase
MTTEIENAEYCCTSEALKKLKMGRTCFYKNVRPFLIEHGFGPVVHKNAHYYAVDGLNKYLEMHTSRLSEADIANISKKMKNVRKKNNKSQWKSSLLPPS